MLLSLPAKTGTSTGDVAIDALKFPVTGAVSSTDTIVTTSPRLPSLSPSLSPSPPMRSKRKSSVPIRSPSSKDSQEASPGVIFQLPFGVPTVPTSPSPRKASTPSSSSTGSGSDTPPHICSYPTPVTTARTAFVSEINSQGAVSEEETGLSRFPTPTSPIDRSGLGIHVQRPLTETAPTHPLESSSAINVGTEVQQQQKPITFTEQDSGASIGDIVIAEQTFGTAVGQRRGEQTTTALSQPEIEVMPTPPSTSKIMPTGVMQGATLCLQDNARITQIPATFPQILFTPCPGYSSRTVDSAGSVKRSSEQTVMAAEGDDEKQEDHDISSLPLREQRLLSIRRRSLIPREDLDFMRGSGILPPASTDLVTKGGAKILSYSVLLSDVVNVQKESMRTQERETEEEELIPMATKAKAKSRPKRKRGGNNRKIHGGARGQRTRAHTHTPDGNDDEDDEEDIEGSLSVDEYDDYDGQEEEHLHVDRQQHGYMSVSSQKRLRSLNGNDVESAETQKTTRIVPERHGPSTYRRRYSKSPTSPSLLHKDPASYTHSPRGSPSLMPEVDIESEDVNMEDAEILIDDYDYDDVHDADGRPQDYHGAKEIPKELWIPAAEVKVVMKLAREMLEAEERLNLHQPQKVARNNNRRPSVKTLKASATDQNGDVADPPKKSKLSTAKSATKVKAKNTSDQPKSVSSPGSTKVKEGKPAKECEACKEKSTPCWRPGYTPGASLCNSCGLRYKKSGVFCPKDGCKYIPLKTEYASMEDERIRAGRDHLLCRSCKGRVERPTRA
ncbi:DNA-binding transcription repressor [Mortierella sp. GBA30]|nr:DNA-binding transcription repressor [Mortierella sp. GBA30]